MIVWFIGLSGAGKSTLTDKLAENCSYLNIPKIVFDGDEVRKYINTDCAFSKEDRLNNVRRVMNICRFTHKHKIFTIVNNIMPYKSLRTQAREIHGRSLMLVYVKCNIANLIERDTKGLYEKASRGEILLSGYNSDWEEPSSEEVDLILETDKYSVEECFNQLTKGIYDHRHKKLEEYGI